MLSPFTYVLSVYLTFFGLVAVLLEMDVEKFSHVPSVGKLAPHLHKYQKNVFEYARFLTQLKGRGAYYIFVGSLAVVQCMLCLFFIVGAFNIFVGVVSIMLAFGMKPPDVGAESVTARLNRATASASGP